MLRDALSGLEARSLPSDASDVAVAAPTSSSLGSSIFDIGSQRCGGGGGQHAPFFERFGFAPHVHREIVPNRGRRTTGLPPASTPPRSAQFPRKNIEYPQNIPTGRRRPACN